MKHLERKLRLHAESKGVTVHADIYISTNTSHLQPEEYRHLLSRIKRAVPGFLAQVPFTDFGIDNIHMVEEKRRA